jgi:cell division septal protein FtsQ
MTHLNKNILLYLLIFSLTALAQKIEKIEINSNRIFSDGEIKQWASLNEGQNFYP